jgi:hypothetical protein
MKSIRRRLRNFTKERGVTLYGGTVVVLLFGVFSLAYFAVPSLFPLSYTSPRAEATQATTEPEAPKVKHLSTPNPLKGIYMSQCAVGTPSFRDGLVKLIDETDLNAVVIDIKDYSGKISFPTNNPLLKNSVSGACGAKDMKDFIEKLHEKNIYVIGRITVFQDPYYAKLYPDQAVQSHSHPGMPWKDYKGLSFVDVSSRPYWEYVTALSKESYNIGFDELNYDYIRYPSDGPMSDAIYINPDKSTTVEEFWKYLSSNKPDSAVMSADLFGMTTTNYDDLNIGQELERALPYFDYIDPMVYPSHYPTGFIGLKDPNTDPYAVVHYSLEHAVARTIATSTPIHTLDGVLIASTSPKLYTKDAYNSSKIRPWLQDFDYGKDYQPVDVTLQIKATNDNGLVSWLFWDAANRYSELKEVLEGKAQ